MNDLARKATFKKRKKGLMKVNELSTLCDACAIIYSPYEAQPEVWPNIGVQRVLAHFKRMPEMEQSKKMANQESFNKQRIVGDQTLASPLNQIGDAVGIPFEDRNASYFED